MISNLNVFPFALSNADAVRCLHGTPSPSLDRATLHIYAQITRLEGGDDRDRFFLLRVLRGMVNDGYMPLRFISQWKRVTCLHLDAGSFASIFNMVDA